jgi:hypothetical protein
MFATSQASQRTSSAQRSVRLAKMASRLKKSATYTYIPSDLHGQRKSVGIKVAEGFLVPPEPDHHQRCCGAIIDSLLAQPTTEVSRSNSDSISSKNRKLARKGKFEKFAATIVGVLIQQPPPIIERAYYLRAHDFGIDPSFSEATTAQSDLTAFASRSDMSQPNPAGRRTSGIPRPSKGINSAASKGLKKSSTFANIQTELSSEDETRPLLSSATSSRADTPGGKRGSCIERSATPYRLPIQTEVRSIFSFRC